MLIVALTGGIGSGKSLAGEFFSELGAIVVDSDQLSRDVIERGTPGFDQVVAAFGDGVLTSGLIDRKKLGEIVFADPSKRSELEAIIHPLVRAAFDEVVSAAHSEDIVINQIPLLAETDGRSRFDYVITIKVEPAIRQARLKKRGLSENEIVRRMAAQVDDIARRAISDFELINDGEPELLLRQIEELWVSTLLPLSRKSQ